jgi:hypothetical protein
VADLQVCWQEIPGGHVAGVLTTQRVMILSSKLEILSSNTAKADHGFPPISLNGCNFSSVSFT